MAGLMPYGDANAIGMEMADEIIPVVSADYPVVAGDVAHARGIPGPVTDVVGQEV